MNLNRVDLIGNLTRDPEVRSVSIAGGDRTVVKFSMAVNTRFSKDKQEVCFVDVEAWGGLADTIGRYCGKGHEIYIEGRLKLDSWTEDGGKNRQKLKVVANKMQFGQRPVGENGATKVNHSLNDNVSPHLDEGDIPF